jgi:hypothetical protein
LETPIVVVGLVMIDVPVCVQVKEKKHQVQGQDQQVHCVNVWKIAWL